LQLGLVANQQKRAEIKEPEELQLLQVEETKR
jgi:hypothetical protein